MIKNPSVNARDAIQSLGREDPLEEEMATHSRMLAWRISWTVEAGRPHSWGCKKSDTAE